LWADSSIYLNVEEVGRIKLKGFILGVFSPQP
jgi:hypothetical protein